ncbi:hypothetical protein BDR04DRAFT_220063 [Suillus decipiens]|nr:hypothetical protein BDR04DRAFT_220063 [Suillus decipiens]
MFTLRFEFLQTLRGKSPNTLTAFTTKRPQTLQNMFASFYLLQLLSSGIWWPCYLRTSPYNSLTDVNENLILNISAKSLRSRLLKSGTSMASLHLLTSYIMDFTQREYLFDSTQVDV